MGRNSKRIIRPINGLRGLTVASAIILHFSASIILLMPVTKKFVLLSNRIVFRMDLFFMLSGFITAYIYISLSERLNFRAYKEFLQARLIRLYPSYLATFLMLIAGVVFAHSPAQRVSFDVPKPTAIWWNRL
jgi:peptidoglycan/LPS O-acetylase OafA/YrhL